MSKGVMLNMDSLEGKGFTIKSHCGCRLVFGPVPISEMNMIMHGFSEQAVMAMDIADRIGASLVIGEPSNIEALRKLDLPVSEKRMAESNVAHSRGLCDVSMWLRTGERGASSHTLCQYIFDIPLNAGVNYPRDPSDLRRCMLFLDATDAHGKIGLMAGVSKEWAALVAVWDALIASLRAEMKEGGTATRTYSMMEKALKSADAS